jgi:RHS repeat-associated protein
MWRIYNPSVNGNQQHGWCRSFLPWRRKQLLEVRGLAAEAGAPSNKVMIVRPVILLLLFVASAFGYAPEPKSWVTARSNSSGALVLSTISSNRLPVAVSFAYDLNGNLTSDGQRVLEYDDANRLTAVTVANLYRTVFVYDGLSRRRIVRDYTWSSGSWQSASETDYVCDGYLPMQERDASGNVLVTYTRGLDLSGTFGGAGGIGGLLARTDGNGSAFYHADIVGNITSLTDSSGNAVARYLNDPFGRPLGMWGPMGPVNRMQVSSMPTDPSGSVHFPYRDYDTTLQRFRTRDLLGERADINPYRINYNNSLSYIDPDGLAPQLVTASYNLNSGAMSVGYADSQFGQGYGIGLHGPLGPGGAIALTMGATMVPGVGEAMDLSVLTDPESRWWELGLAGASLGLNALTDGLLPNAGGFIKALKRCPAKGATYLLREPATGKVMRTGRSNDILRRAGEHGRDPALSGLRLERVDLTDVYEEQRGLEQLLHDKYDPPLNRNNPIDPSNPNRQRYLDAAQEFLEGGGR